MDKNSLQHYGILGMKWGVRKTGKSSQNNSKLKSKSDKTKDNNNPEKKLSSVSNSKSKSLKEMSDSELRDKISRLELEKRYRDLSKSNEIVKTNKGKAFVMDILEKSGKNIATQAATYAMGELVNKIVGSDVVNPKKGQKDK